MKFLEASIPGVFIIDTDPHLDERGSFARTFCVEEFAAHGLPTHVAQCSVSTNPVKGTLRGIHFQAAPKAETKLVRCAQGAIFDVVVDVRVESPTFRRWFGVELLAETLRAVFIPEGCAHGFITLTPDTEILYQMGAVHEPALARGVRWDDPAISISWPFEPALISERDAAFPYIQI